MHQWGFKELSMRLLGKCTSWKRFLMSSGSDADNEAPLGLGCIAGFSVHTMGK